MNPEQQPDNNSEPVKLLTIADKRAIIAKLLHPDYRSKRHVVKKGQIVVVEEQVTPKQRLQLLKLDKQLADTEQRRLQALEPRPPKLPIKKDHKAPVVKVTTAKQPSVMFLRRALR